ncbi:MAG: carotenoid oxygenase family protein [Ectothiorhodospiraceae bacterium]|nr:carotenoid oxygenase family protein [Ectothiorhodospiraceae bacterium]MCH8504026.1 carotenoid oxygenase family protein [Ectothiorhodospiraceae bacterium]
MNRRTFLQRTLVGGGAALLAPSSLALAGEWKQAYAQASAAQPWLLGLRTVERESLRTESLKLEGAWPKQLSGMYYRNGPGRHERGERRYRHWFDGDGMVQAFRIGDGGVSHRGRFVETDKYQAERAANRMLRPGFGTRFPDMEAISSADQVNAGNINVIRHGDRLLALWEDGSAWDLDPQTLETRGTVTWREDLRAIPFSAHPRRDPDGSLWNFGTLWQIGPATERPLVIYHIDPAGRLKRAEAVSAPPMPYVHDFAVTERHLVFLLPPLPLEAERLRQGHSILESHRWQPDEPMRVLTIDKNDWERQRWYELPAGFVFHLGNAWEERNGVVHLDYIRYEDPAIMRHGFSGIMRGERPTMPWGHPARVTLHPDTGKATQRLLDGFCEFPTIDTRLGGQRQRYLVVPEAVGDPEHPWFNALRRIDLDRETDQHYVFGPGVIVEEHVVVPKRADAPDGDAWLLGTVLDTVAEVTRLTLFDAARLAEGPIAVATLPYPLPLGFHSHFDGA